MAEKDKMTNNQSQKRGTNYRRNSLAVVLLFVVAALLALSVWKIRSFPSHPWYRSVPNFVKQLAAIATVLGTGASLLLETGTFVWKLLTKRRSRISFRRIGRSLHSQFNRVVTQPRLFHICLLGLSVISS